MTRSKMLISYFVLSGVLMAFFTNMGVSEGPDGGDLAAEQLQRERERLYLEKLEADRAERERLKELRRIKVDQLLDEYKVMSEKLYNGHYGVGAGTLIIEDHLKKAVHGISYKLSIYTCDELKTKVPDLKSGYYFFIKGAKVFATHCAGNGAIAASSVIF